MTVSDQGFVDIIMREKAICKGDSQRAYKNLDCTLPELIRAVWNNNPDWKPEE